MNSKKQQKVWNKQLNLKSLFILFVLFAQLGFGFSYILILSSNLDTPTETIDGNTDNNFNKYHDYPESAFTGATGSLEWFIPLAYPFESVETPALWDIDEDGYLEILIEVENKLYCFSGENGNEQWNVTGVGGPAVISDIDNDNEMEILIGPYYQMPVFSVYSYTGSHEWTFDGYDPNAIGMLAVGDVDKDTTTEIVCYHDDPTAIAIVSGTSQSEERSFPTPGNWAFIRPLITDIDNDGVIEILSGYYDLGSNYVFYSIEGHTATEDWNYTINPAMGFPVVADVDDDNQLEVLIGSGDDKLYCLSSTGYLEWDYTTGGDVLSTPAIADIDLDGEQEIIFGSDDNQIYCLDGLGNKNWNYTTQGKVSSSPAIGDIDGDGAFEILIGSGDNHLYCLSNDGKQEWNYTASGDIDGGIMLCDVDGDNKLEIIFYAQNDGLYCLRGNGPSWGIPTSSWYKGSIAQTSNFIDSDDDGLNDDFEKSMSLNINLADSDGDGLDDGIELANLINPSNNDTDSDGMTDGWEIDNYFDPLVDSDATEDPDNDLLNNLEEFNAGTDPQNNDTDGDDLIDGDEILTYETDPLDEDTDGDTYSDGEEINAGTDPLDPTSYPVSTNGTDKSFLDQYFLFILIGLISIIGIMSVAIAVILVKPKFLEKKQIKKKATKVKENIESFKHELVSFIIDKLKNQYGESSWDLGIPESVKKELDDKVIKKKGD